MEFSLKFLVKFAFKVWGGGFWGFGVWILSFGFLINFFMFDSLTNSIFTWFQGLLDLERLFSETFYFETKMRTDTPKDISSLFKSALKPLTYLTNREYLWLIWYL